MRLQKEKDQCSGCSACVTICSHHAITLQADHLGFKYPKVDPLKCIDCGLCELICPFHENYDTKFNYQEPLVYAVRYKDEEELMHSQSGGAFIALSDRILEDRGVVYGVGYDKQFKVIHQRATNKDERNCLRGSKYVQSNLEGIFQSIKKDLKQGKTVLFTGTPCQTAGLHACINNKLQENLYLVDLVCHGVPSPAVWADYLKYVEKRSKGKIQEINFRDKTYGWKSSITTFLIDDRKVKDTSYSYLFYKNIMQRKSCSKCPFTNLHRPSDITIGDFWGWEKHGGDFQDNKGVSLVLINTEKGNRLFQRVIEDIYLYRSNTKMCLQPQLQKPALQHPLRDNFERDYDLKGFEFINRKYGNVNWKHVCRVVLSKIKRNLLKYFSSK